MPESEAPQPENAFRSFQKELKRTNELLSRQTSFFRAFLRGMFAGVGGFLGATIVITIIIWSLSRLQVIPIIGDFATTVVQLINGINSN